MYSSKLYIVFHNIMRSYESKKQGERENVWVQIETELT